MHADFDFRQLIWTPRLMGALFMPWGGDYFRLPGIKQFRPTSSISFIHADGRITPHWLRRCADDDAEGGVIPNTSSVKSAFRPPDVYCRLGQAKPAARFSPRRHERYYTRRMSSSISA